MGRARGETAPPEPGHRELALGPGDAVLVAAILGAAFAAFVATPNHWTGDGPFSILPAGALARWGDLGLRGGASACAAALVAAAFAGLAYLTGRLALSRPFSVLVAGVAVLGTPVTSDAARILGGGGWALLFTGGIAFLLLRAAVRGRAPSGVALGTLASLAACARPTAVLGVVGVATYLAAVNRRALGRFAVTTSISAGALAVVALSRVRLAAAWLDELRETGRGAAQGLGSGSGSGVLDSLLGHLVSPGRGVLLFAPALAVAAVVSVALRRRIRFPALARLAWALAAAHALALALAGGLAAYGFGARLWTEVVPWLLLLAIAGLDAVEPEGREALQSWAGVAAVLGCAASVGINVLGAASFDAVAWNVAPADVVAEPWRVWDWRQPQLLAPFVPPPGGYRAIPGDGIALGTDAAAPFLGPGWSYAEGDFRWTAGRAALIRFAAEAGLPDALQIQLRPHLAPGGALDGQRLRVIVNGRLVAEAVAAAPGFARRLIEVPPRYLRVENTLWLILPDAVSPRSVGESADERVLGVAVRSIGWAYARPLPDAGLRPGGEDAAPYLTSGWSYAEGDFRWTDGPSAVVRFAGELPAPDAIEIDLRPRLRAASPGVAGGQRVTASLNGVRVWSAELTSPGFELHAIPIPPGAIKERNTLSLDLPDAAAVGTADQRRLGVAVRSIRWIRHRTLSGHGVGLASAESAPYLGSGWSVAEEDFRWTDGPSATVTLGDRDTLPDALAFELRPFVVPGKLERQRLAARLNGHEVSSRELTTEAFQRVVVPLPASFVTARDNVLAFVLPDATAPAAIGFSPDGRRLGIAVRAMREAIGLPDILPGSSDADRYLGAGWSNPEADFRWTNGERAEVTFESETRAAQAIELDLAPYLVRGKVDHQELEVVLNRRSISREDLRTPGFAAHVIALPPNALEEKNTLVLRLPDATSPSVAEQSTDTRRLGVAVRSIRAARLTPAVRPDSGPARRW